MEAIMKSYGYFPKPLNNIVNIIYFGFIFCSRGYNYTDCESSSQDPTQPNMYEVEITPEKRTYPKAYDFCQQILEQKCLEDPFICGKLLISNYYSNFVPIQPFGSLLLFGSIQQCHYLFILAIGNLSETGPFF